MFLAINCFWCGVTGIDLVIEKVDTSKSGQRMLDSVGLGVYCGLIVVYHVWFIGCLISGVSESGAIYTQSRCRFGKSCFRKLPLENFLLFKPA